MPVYSCKDASKRLVRRVFLDGVEFPRVYECNTDECWLRAYDLHPIHGLPYVIDGNVVKIERRGVVTVELVTP